MVTRVNSTVMYMKFSKSRCSKSIHIHTHTHTHTHTGMHTHTSAAAWGADVLTGLPWAFHRACRHHRASSLTSIGKWRRVNLHLSRAEGKKTYSLLVQSLTGCGDRNHTSYCNREKWALMIAYIHGSEFSRACPCGIPFLVSLIIDVLCGQLNSVPQWVRPCPQSLWTWPWFKRGLWKRK